VNFISGVFGPWQILVISGVIGAIIVGVISLISKSAKNKAKASTLQGVIDGQ
jgi:hypothetical protein